MELSIVVLATGRLLPAKIRQELYVCEQLSFLLVLVTPPRAVPARLRDGRI